MHRTVSVLAVLLLALGNCAWAQNQATKGRYGIYYYNSKAVRGSKLTDQQCQVLLSVPVTYDIKDDQVFYLTDANAQYQFKEYQRDSQVFINDQTDLYTGHSKVLIKYQGQSMPVLASLAFIHDKNTSTVRGHIDIPGYCCSDYIGVDSLAGQPATG